jgi:hypothetical protein
MMMNFSKTSQQRCYGQGKGEEVILASRKGHASETNVAFLIMQK